MEIIFDFEAFTIRQLCDGDLELENPSGESVRVNRRDFLGALEKLIEDNM